MGIGQHYIIRRDIRLYYQLYICPLMHYGYVIEVIVIYCDNTCTSKTELDTVVSKMRQTTMHMYIWEYFFYELHAYGYRPALHN